MTPCFDRPDGHRATLARPPWPRAALAVLLALLAALVARPAWADPPGRVGRLAETQGNVWIYDAERGGWDAALRNRPVTAGDRVATDDGARAAIQVGSATLRLGGASEVEWVQLDDDAVRVSVVAGSVALRVFSADVAHEFQLLTPHGRVLPLFAGHYRVDLLADSTVVEALQGEAVFDAADSRKTVVSGQRVAFWQRNGGRTFYDTITTPLDDFGRWLLAVQRDEQRAWASTRHVSPETTGWEDLDRYGRWDSHPQYGFVWIPFGVAVDWAPYRYGRWVWVAPWGWTWVDDAPWGFAPFHYGRWVWWDGRWAWWPGSYVRRPVYAPALVGWIGGSNFSIGISVGTGPWVGWVPLSPYDVYRPWYRVTRPPVHVPPPRPVPRDRAATYPSTSSYFYLGVPGSVTVVSRQVLEQRRPVGPAEWRRVDPDEWRRAGRPPAVVSAPPPPAFGASPARPAVPPPPPRPPRGGPGDRDDRGGDRNGGPRGNDGARFGGDEPRPVPPAPPARNEIRDRNEIGDRNGPRGRDEVPRQPPPPVDRGRGPAPEPGPRFDAPPRGEVPRPPAPAPQAPAFERERERDRDRERDAVPPAPRGPQRPPVPASGPGFSRGDVPPSHAAGVGVRATPPFERGADAGPPGRRAMAEPTERVPRFERAERPDGPSAPPGLRAMPPDAVRAPMASSAPPAFARERVQPVVPGGREGRGPVPDDAQVPRAQPPVFDPRAVAR